MERLTIKHCVKVSTAIVCKFRQTVSVGDVKTPLCARLCCSAAKNPDTCIRYHVQELNLSTTMLHRILTKDLSLHACKIQLTQERKHADHLELRTFVNWVHKQRQADEDFLQKKNLFSDEAHFHLGGFINKQNCHIWADENSRKIVEKPLHPQKLNQVETALQASVPDENLIQLRADLKELISLTEENLLALRKRQLLSELEATDNEQPNLNSSSQSSNAKDMDAEYAAFKALIDDGESTSGTSEKRLQSENSQIADCSSNDQREAEGTNSSEEDDKEENKNLTESLKSLIGKKCQAPFNTEWSMYGTHNAIITDVLDFNPPDPAQILVMFSNPTHRAMVPCQYFLNGKCKFSDEKCNFSHGHIVKLDEIKPYEEPDYSSLQINGKCLARFTDKLWYRAKVESIEADGRFVVSFEIKNDVLVVSHEEIMPFSEQSKETLSEVSTSHSESDDDEENASAIIKYIAPKTTQAMGEWEAHTKGFGSRIMAKMGYIVGQGLGKNGEGKAEPVPIEVLPSGKSLDTIMQLKEQAANKDLFSAFNNEKKKQKKIEQRNKNAYNKPENTNVFDFINNRLSQRKDGSGSSSSGKKKHHQSGHDSTNKDTKHISLKDLSKKSDRTLNVQHMKTEGELRRVEKEILRLKDSILRNEDKNKSIVKQLELKIAGLENYKKQLQVSETAIGQQKKQRSDHKKLTIF